ncbi:cytochrome P450 71A8-like [Primulina huaijiensis]|uniref:cytochrome P450 71A8-like n=1 Tax=Primulina huaijiensis TaxID=1492673 RepID=UPI003CC76BE2
MLLNPFPLLIISLFLVYLVTKWIYKPCSKKILPPSPPKLPIFGNLHQLRALTHRSFQSLGRKYGPVLLLHFGSKPVFIVQSANVAMEIMKTNDLIFADKPTSRSTDKLFFGSKDISVAPYGEYWRKMKSMCILQLLNAKRVQSFRSIREEETSLLMERIKSTTSSHLPVNLSELFLSLTNDVICRSAFGRKYTNGKFGKRFPMLLKELLQLLGGVNIGEFIPYFAWTDRFSGFDAKVDKVAKEFDEFLEIVIQEHMNTGQDKGDAVSKEEKSRESFVDILLKIYKDNVTGVYIDRDNIKGIILDILAGGTDTASAALEWAMTELLRHPTVLKKLQKEVREILEGKKDITDNDLEKMHYLKAVIKETLRYHVPVPFLARVARDNTKIRGYDIASGTLVIINAWAIGRDPASWIEPEKFKPERFLNTSVDFRGQDFGLIPFGSGRRGCPGITFAMASVELVLANLMQKFNWDLPDGKKGEELDVIEHPGVTIHRKNPLFAVATECCLTCF